MKASTSCVLQLWTACCLFPLFPFHSVSAQVTGHLTETLPIAANQCSANEKSWVQFDCDAFALPIKVPSVNGRGAIQEKNSCPALLTEPLRTYQQFYPIILVHTPNTPFILLVNFYRTDTAPNRISRFIDLLDRRQSRWAAASLPGIREPVVVPYIPAAVNMTLITC